MNLSENNFKVKSFYEAADLANVTKKRAAYLAAVDDYVVSNKESPSILDVGAGDGSRILRIATRLNGKVTTIDVTNKSYQCCRDLGFDAHLNNIENFVLEENFDVITCLWSVLGYVNPHYALKNMKYMLAQEGVLFFDVNVRYNLAEYGILNCVKNIARDFFNKPKPFSIGGCNVYLFDYWELDETLKNLGFKFEKVYLDYRTGKRTSMFFGQILYICTHDVGE